MKFIIPLIILILFIPFSASWDLALSHYFFENGSFSTHEFWPYIYDYGVIPAQITTAAAFCCLIASYFVKKIAPYRRIFLLLVLTLVIGSGLIAHALFKDHWGRPRPKQITEFGGIYPFFPFYKPNFLGSHVVTHPENADRLRSFPCGHCTMGFYFFALALALRRLERKKLSIAVFVFALILGGILSIMRIAMGGHFLSDTLASLIIMWLTAVTLDALLFKKRELL